MLILRADSSVRAEQAACPETALRGKSMVFESAAAAILAMKAWLIKALLGMLGAALLYLVLPPGDPLPKQALPKQRAAYMARRKRIAREIVLRIGMAGIFSLLLGDWTVAVLDHSLPWLMAGSNPHPFWLACGAPGWWISRWIALWLHRREAEDIAEVISDLKPRFKQRQD